MSHLEKGNNTEINNSKESYEFKNQSFDSNKIEQKEKVFDDCNRKRNNEIKGCDRKQEPTGKSFDKDSFNDCGKNDRKSIEKSSRDKENTSSRRSENNAKYKTAEEVKNNVDYTHKNENVKSSMNNQENSNREMFEQSLKGDTMKNASVHNIFEKTQDDNEGITVSSENKKIDAVKKKTINDIDRLNAKDTDVNAIEDEHKNDVRETNKNIDKKHEQEDIDHRKNDASDERKETDTISDDKKELKQTAQDNSLERARSMQLEARKEKEAKFEETQKYQRGTDDYRNALREYNEAQKREEKLSNECAERRSKYLTDGNATMNESVHTVAEAKRMEQEYDNLRFNEKLNTAAMADLRSRNAESIETLSRERESIKLAMEAKMDQMQEFANNHNLDRYATEFDGRYNQSWKRYGEEYNELKERQQKLEYYIAKLGENNRQISETIGEPKNWDTAAYKKSRGIFSQKDNSENITNTSAEIISETKDKEELSQAATVKALEEIVDVSAEKVQVSARKDDIVKEAETEMPLKDAHIDETIDSATGKVETAIDKKSGDIAANSTAVESVGDNIYNESNETVADKAQASAVGIGAFDAQAEKTSTVDNVGREKTAEADSNEEPNEIVQPRQTLENIRDVEPQPPTLKEIKKLAPHAYEVAKSHYDKAEEVAAESNLRYYKAHDLDGHINKVIERSQESADVIEKVIPEIELDRADIAAAALLHDTGMDGGDKFEPTDGDGIRKNHAMTSALHVLENREALERDRCNVDQVAALALLHSKKCSGVGDLSSNEQIKQAFGKLQKEVDNYNDEHPEAPIRFNSNPFYVDDKFEKINDRFKYNATALRLGDAYGHDSSSTKTQSGEHIDNISFGESTPVVNTKWNESAWREEIKNDILALKDKDGNKIRDIDEEADKDGYTRMFQFGEGNITAMHLQERKGDFETVIDVKNGNAHPLCTQECIIERLKEMGTAQDLVEPHEFSTTINIYGECDEQHKVLYESFANNEDLNKFYGTIRVNYIKKGEEYND